MDFSVINFPTYDEILGKPWLDKWNPIINWKENTMQWKVGTRLISVAGVQDPKEPTIVSSIFERGTTIEQISAERMKKLAKKEPIIFEVVRTMNEEPRNEYTITMNEDKTKTPYLVEV